MYKFLIFPLHCSSRNAMSSKVFNEFTKTFFWLNRWWRWLLRLNISIAQIFWFCNNNATTFPTSRKCKNFYFSISTVPAEMLYLQRLFEEFSKTFFWLNNDEGGYCGWDISSAQIFWFCNSNVTNFPTSRKFIKFQFFHLHCPIRNAISSEVFNEFSKFFFWLKDEDGGYCGWKFQVHRYFGFAIPTVQLYPTSIKCINFNFSLYTVPSRNAISSKVFNEFSKTFFWLKDE